MKKVNIKKLALVATLALCSGGAFAQNVPTVSFSTFTETNLSTYNGKACNVNFGRYVFAGWNSFCVPFDLSAEQIASLFGTSAQVERLTTCSKEGNKVTLNFQSCTSDGVKANTAYLLYAPETKYVYTTLKGILVNQATPIATTLPTGDGNSVTFAGTYSFLKGAGRFGIPAKQNIDGLVESNLVNTETYNGFYPTRCYFTWSGNNTTELKIKHVAATESTVTKITDIASKDEVIDIYSVNGQKVRSQIKTSDAIKSLRGGIYIVNGVKVLIK
jgi:hypothetical protein